jgi:hypothetical protein
MADSIDVINALQSKYADYENQTDQQQSTAQSGNAQSASSQSSGYGGGDGLTLSKEYQKEAGQ